MNYIKEITLFVKTNVDAESASNERNENKPEKKDANDDSTLNISNEGYIPLTHSMIVQPPLSEADAKKPKSSFKYNETPYFTNYILYPSSLKSYLLDKGYEEIQKFFFNQSHFKTVLQTVGIYIDPSINQEERNNNSLPNIEFMISLLFPTTFPAYNNIISSYDTIFKGDSTSSTSTTMTLYDYMPKYIKDAVSIPNHYSYIKIGGNIHTIYRVVVVNDIINHPKYNFLIDKVHTFFEEFDKERDDVISSLITKFVKIRNVLDFLESNFQYLEMISKKRENFQYEKLKLEFSEIGIFKENERKGLVLVDDETIKRILKPIFKENNNTYLFGKYKKALSVIVKNANYLSEYAVRDALRNTNNSYDISPVSDSDISKIKDYLKYYEIFEKYYQYDSYYSKKDGSIKNIPILKNIFYNTNGKKKDDDDDGYPGYFRNRSRNTFDVEKEAKDILQSSKSMSNYQSIFETFNSVSSTKVMTDNTYFNAILRTFVNIDDAPDNFLLYLYQFLSLLTAKKDMTLQRVLMEDKIIIPKQDDIEKYCKMTIVNTMQKKGKTKVSVGKYSVYLRMDLIAGRLDDTNVSKIRCNYTGEQLGNTYLKMLVPQEYWEIKPLPYLKLDSILEKEKDVPKKGQAQTRRKPAIKRGGIRSRRHRYRVRHREL
jgi:hypothetical protein